MIILDTMVLSALMHDVPDRSLSTWLDLQPPTSTWTTSVTVFEIRLGLEIMPDGKKKLFLSDGFERVLDRMEHRVVVFDEEAARRAANLTAFRRTKGKIVELRDTMIAGIVLAHDATLATRNVAHFSDIAARVINPWSV